MQTHNTAQIFPTENIFLQKAFNSVLLKAATKISNISLTTSLVPDLFNKLAFATLGYDEIKLKLCEAEKKETKFKANKLTFGNHTQPIKTLNLINKAIDSSIDEIKNNLCLQDDMVFDKKRILATILIALSDAASDKLIQENEKNFQSN